MSGLQPVAPIAERAINHSIMRGLQSRLADERAIADRRARDSFADGLRRGRRAALGWLLVGAASGFLAALALGFAVYW